MAKKLKAHEAVSDAYLEPALRKPVIRRYPFPASAVWAALLDAKAWSEWLPITRVTWTSPEPFGVGTTRTVETDKEIIKETFFAWEEGRRMAFRFEQSTLPVSAGVEDYSVVEVEGGCELHWSGRASAIFPLGWIISRQLASGIKAGMPKLESLIAADPSRFGLGS